MATCSSADSVLDAASLIKSNGTKLNDFVNGRADQTVQLGESTDTPTPTLRNLVANALEHVAESMGDSVEAAITTINELENTKADKVDGDVEDHIAALDVYGNLQDSGIGMEDVATKSVDIANLDTDKADKVSGATAGDIATLNASGNLVDSGVKPGDKADKVSGATNGHLAGLNASGNLTDSGKSPSDIIALENGKADKVSSATDGHIAGLNASGNLTDSGIAGANVQTKLAGHTANNLLSVASSGFMADSGIAKADVQTKLTGHTAGNVLSATSGGFMQDSGIASSNVALKSTDIANLQATKANKVSGATAGDIAVLDASGDLADSGVKPGDKADKVANAVAGNFAGLDASGNLTDSGRSPADIAALEESVDSLEERKADKFIPAEAGNLAKLSSDGNIRDAGKAAEDFTPLLDYANGEAQKLALFNNMSNELRRHTDAIEANAEDIREASRESTSLLSYTNGEAQQLTQGVHSLINAFDESYAQHRLMQRLFDGTNPGASSKPVLFVISGQSNAVGCGKYTPFDAAEDCGQFWSWHDSANRLKPIFDPIGAVSDRGSGWCAFARRFFALTGRKVILLNIASGASAVTDGGYETTNTWADNEYGNLRSSRQTIWNAFSLAVPSTEYELGAILWIQGETEADRLYAGTVTVNDYINGTFDVFSWTRGLVGNESCPIFVGKIAQNIGVLSNSSLATAYKLIQNAQNTLYNYTDIFPGFSTAPYFGLPLVAGWSEYMSDVNHYSRKAYSMLGNAFARSVVNFLNF